MKMSMNSQHQNSAESQEFIRSLISMKEVLILILMISKDETRVNNMLNKWKSSTMTEGDEGMVAHWYNSVFDK